MRTLLIALAFFWGAHAQATLYFAAFNPQTGEKGLVYSSSGGHFWQTLVKGRGLAGAQNYGLCDEATPDIFLSEGFSASEVASKIKAQCDAADYHTYRFLVITDDGKMDYIIGRDGCLIPDCGVRSGENFMVTGGGLRAGVLDGAVAAFAAQDSKLSFKCRLFRTLREVYVSGGEEKEFRGASITIDDPARGELFNIRADLFSGGAQGDLLSRLSEQLDEVCD